MLHAQLIRLKALETVAIDRNRDDVKDYRRHFAEWLMTKHRVGNETVNIDESDFKTLASQDSWSC